MFYAIIWPGWYDDSIDSKDTTIYGLLLTERSGITTVNGFENEDNKEIGGISSFLLFLSGLLVQILQIIQLLLFFRRYHSNRESATESY